MSFKDLSSNREILRQRASGVSKEAGWVGRTALAPITKPLSAIGRGFLKGTWAATKRTSGPGLGKALAPIMYGAGLVGVGGAAVHGYNKYKKYNMGFDPRLQKQAGVSMNSSALMQKVAEVAPKEYNFILKTAEEVRLSPFRDEIVRELQSSIEKAAGIPETIGRSLAIGVPAMIIGGVAATLAGDMYDSVKRGLTKTRNYKKMLAANQDLSSEDPAVKANFETLHRFNPEYSADPNVAGGYVRHARQFPSDIGMVHGLVSSRKAIRDSRSIRTMPLPFDNYVDEEMRDAELKKHKAQTSTFNAQRSSAYEQKMKGKAERAAGYPQIRVQEYQANNPPKQRR